MNEDDASDGHSRRRILATVAAAGIPLLAGCNEGSEGQPTQTDPPDTPQPTETATATTGETTTPTATSGEQSPTPTPSVSITEIAYSADPVGQFQPTRLAVTVANEGGGTFQGTIRIDVDGLLADLFEVTVAPGDATDVTMQFQRAAVGNHPVEIAVVSSDGEVRTQRTTTLGVKPYPPHRVTVEGTRLQCGDGTAFYGGASLANAFAPENNRPSEASLEPAFDTLADLGVSSARIWGFAPSWADISSMPAPDTYNDAWFQYFDRVIVAAKKRDIRLFVPLFNGNPAYGPVTEENLSVNVPQFVRWADDAQTRNDFFESEECMRMYEGWVERVLTNENHITGLEYRNDPTIAMWELGNEIQRSPPRVGESIRPWFERAGRFVKELDDQTLLTTGSYGHQGRNAFVDEARADPIDVVSIHYYPGPEHYDMPEDEVVPTLESTIRTVHKEVGKPLYVGEYNWGVGPEDAAPYTERAGWVARLQRVMREGEVAATNFHIVADEQRPTSFHKPATVYAPDERRTLDVIADHARLTREMSGSGCV